MGTMFLFRFCDKLLGVSKTFQSVRHLSNKTALICRTHRLYYARTYPTTIVEPDGSSYTVRHFEPRRIIKLPLDLSGLSEEEKKMRLEQRKPKTKVVITEEVEDNFKANKYLHYIKKKK